MKAIFVWTELVYSIRTSLSELAATMHTPKMILLFLFSFLLFLGFVCSFIFSIFLKNPLSTSNRKSDGEVASPGIRRVCVIIARNIIKYVVDGHIQADSFPDPLCQRQVPSSYIPDKSPR